MKSMNLWKSTNKEKKKYVDKRAKKGIGVAL